jgi:hypothetical protein
MYSLNQAHGRSWITSASRDTNEAPCYGIAYDIVHTSVFWHAGMQACSSEQVNGIKTNFPANSMSLLRVSKFGSQIITAGDTTALIQYVCTLYSDTVAIALKSASDLLNTS